jgi:dUTP pyrophosphatase
MTLRPIQFELHDACQDLLPKQAHWGDAGLDLYTAMDFEVSVAVGRIPTSVRAMKFPVDFWGLIHARSSTRERWGLEVRTSVIDEGYTGPLYIGYQLALGVTGPVMIPRGTRLGQLVIMRSVLNHLPIERVDSIEELPNERGKNGFGSTGH